MHSLTFILNIITRFAKNQFSLQIRQYHLMIKKPIALDVIKAKLDPKSDNHYIDLKQVLADIRLMFKNAFTFNSVRILTEIKISKLNNNELNNNEGFPQF